MSCPVRCWDDSDGARRAIRRPALDSAVVPTFKAAYLIHGDDHGRIGERRTRLRAMAESESGHGRRRGLRGRGLHRRRPSRSALSAMTFAIGRRFVIADGVERWKDAGAEEVATALAGIDPESLTVAFFAREDGRLKVPAALVEGGQGRRRPDRRGEPGQGRASCRGGSASAPQSSALELDDQAARALIAQVGDRQQRLLRELEKLALEYGAGATIGVEEVEESLRELGRAQGCGRSPTRSSPATARAPLARCVELREQGERLPGLLYNMVRRLRDALAIAEALAAGQPPAQIKKGLRMPGFAADRLIADAAAATWTPTAARSC